jgi:hypothetical protein
LTNPVSDGAILVLPDDPKRHRMRFLFAYEESFRIVAWLMVGSEGSVYFNHRIRSPRRLFSATGISDGAGGYAELSKIAEREPSQREDPKVSFHASGIVTRGNDRNRSVSLRTIREPTLIRQDEFAHPSRFDSVATPRPWDIVVPNRSGSPFWIIEERPLAARIWASPLVDGEAQVIAPHDLPSGGTSIVIPYKNLDRCPNLTIQIHFFNHAPGKPWPEQSTMAVLDL